MNLRNNVALVLISAATGFIGLGVGYKIAEKKLGQEFEERLERETNLVRRMYKPEYDTPEEMIAALHGDEEAAVEAVRSLIEYAGEKPEPTAYNKIRVSGVQVVKDSAEEEVVARRIFEADDNRGEIYVISAEEHAESDAGYEQVTWTYYAEDGVVTDVHEDRIEDYEKVLGNEFVEKFGEESDDENVVYIRNEVIMIDYEILKDPRSYRRVVLEEEPKPERASQRMARGG